MLVNHYVIRCDTMSCTESITGSVFKGALKAEAKATGWTSAWSFWGRTHICPKCQSKARGEDAQNDPSLGEAYHTGYRDGAAR